jgi:uncharacterized protein (DUF342 family)
VNDASPTDALKFKLSDDGKLLAEFEGGESKQPLDEEMINEALARQGFADLFLYKNSLSHLVQQYNNPNEGFVLEIGERRDGGFTLKIADDKMTASLTIIPPCGGEPVTLVQIQRALREKGVVSGIMINEIEAAIKTGNTSDLIVAMGLPPVKGTDARFQSLIPEIRERKPQINERGIADYRNLGQLIVVNPGDPLMCRTPPTRGKKGRDITGKILMPQPGQDTPFASGLKGVEFDQNEESDPDNNSLLLAAITGQPKLVLNGVIVESTINFPKVDISTGNINFTGTIHVKGDVTEGMKIHASVDIFVDGTVEAAEIEAGGNIVIKGGVIGHTEHGGEPGTFNARIISQGSISVRFAENTSMEAGEDIIIEKFSMHNHLTSLHRILVGKHTGKNGRIIGGLTCASDQIRAGVIGSDAGFITKVNAGVNPYLQAKLDKLTLGIDANERELEDIKKIVSFILAHPEKDKNGLLSKALHTKDKIEADSARLHTEQSSALAGMILAEHAQIIVEEGIHCGTEIRIGHHIWKNNEKRGKGVFQLVGGTINFGRA